MRDEQNFPEIVIVYGLEVHVACITVYFSIRNIFKADTGQVNDLPNWKTEDLVPFHQDTRLHNILEATIKFIKALSYGNNKMKNRQYSC